VKEKIPVVCAVFILILVCLYIYPSAIAQDEGTSAISAAQSRILTCFELARQAESEGANITSLTSKLNAASNLLSEAQVAYASGDLLGSRDIAIQSQSILTNFENLAIPLKNSAIERNTTNFWVNTVAPMAGSLTVAVISFLVWQLVKKQYGADR
jgi:hypothetical protein